MQKKLAKLWATTLVALFVLSFVAAAAIEGFWHNRVPETFKFVLRNVFRASDYFPTTVGEKEWIHPDYSSSAGAVSAMMNICIFPFVTAFRAFELGLWALNAGLKVITTELDAHHPQFRSAPPAVA